MTDQPQGTTPPQPVPPAPAPGRSEPNRPEPSRKPRRKQKAKVATEEHPERVAQTRKVAEGATTDWRAQLLIESNGSGEQAKDAKAHLDSILEKGSEEELKAFASLGYAPAQRKLEPAKGAEPSLPGEIVGTQVTGDTTGNQEPKDKK